MNDSTKLKCDVEGCSCEVDASNLEEAILRLQKHTKEKHPNKTPAHKWHSMQEERLLNIR